MLLSTVLVLSLVQGIFAAWQDFRVSKLRAVACNGFGRTSVKFTFDDPNTNQTAGCEADFARNGTDGAIVLPDSYLSCDNDPWFGWTLSEFESVRKFTLELRRSYRDPSVGDPPQDILTLFGERNITGGEDTRCWTPPRRALECSTPANSTVIVLVTSAIA